METQLIPNDLPSLEPDLPILDPPVENTEIQKFENSPNPTSSTIQSEEYEAPALGNPMQTDEIVVEENIMPEEKENSIKKSQEPNKSAQLEEIASDQNDLIINEPFIQEENYENIIEPKILQEKLDQQVVKTSIQEENENLEEIVPDQNNLVSVQKENNEKANDQINLEDAPFNDDQYTLNFSIEREENKNLIKNDQEIPESTKLEESSSNENPLFIDTSIQEEVAPKPESLISPYAQTTPKSTSKTPYYPQFMLSKIPSSHSFEETSSLLLNELQKHGEIFKLEKKDNFESSFYNVLFSFALDKNAVIALKSPIWIDLGNNENNIYRVKVEPTPGFIKYLTDLSSSLKNPKSNSSPQNETKSPPLKNKTQEKHNHSENKSAESKSNKERSDSRSAQKKLTPKKEIPLEIVKVHKSSPRKSKHPTHSSYRRSNRSKSRSHSRDYDREASYERDLSPKRYSRSEIKKRRESSSSIERSIRRERNAAKEFYSHTKPIRKGSMALEERKFMGNEIQRPRRNSSPKVKTICLVPAKNQKEDLRKILKTQQQQQQKQKQRECWTDDDDDCEFVCYAIGVPLEYDEPDIKNLLKKDGFSGYIRVRTRNFEGLDYLKITFETKNDAQRALTKPIFVNDIPIIMIPKLPNRDPFGMLSFHQLKIRSLSGPIESKIIYEFLLKFGTITDFLILDLLEFPTTFLATFTNNASKRNLAACYPTNTARISDEKGREYSIQFELNIKPALVIRKKLKETIIYQYKEAAAQFLREMSRQIENEVIFTNPAVSSPSLNYSQQVPPPSLNTSSNSLNISSCSQSSIDLISPVSSHNPNPYTFSPNHAYSLSNQMSSMNLNQSPTGPFASRQPQFSNIGPLSLPPNQNFNYNQQQQNTFLPNNRSHPVNTYLPQNQPPHYLQYEEPQSMIQETPYDVDKFLAGNSNQNPFRGIIPNQENQYFLSNIGPGQNLNNYYPY